MFPSSNSSRIYTCILVSVLLILCGHASAQDVTTFHNDNSRSAVQSNEVALTKSNVNPTLFGKTLTFAVDGDVYAQPLYLGSLSMSDGKVHNVLFVATQHDYVYAFDASGNNPAAGFLWRTHLIPSSETWVSSTDVGTGDITPDIGITGTPVIDRGGSTLYVVAKSKTTSGTTTFIQRLHALSLSDGSEKLSGPTLIQATVTGTAAGGSTVAFDPLRNNQRPALLFAPTPGAGSGNSVFIAWASHGDNTPYHGWVISYNAANISQQTGVWNDTPNGVQGGIWMSGGGLATDGTGNIFGASGNGAFNANTGGPDYGDSLFKLTASSSGLSVTDWFTPIDQSSLDGSDQDFGVSGPVLLPAQSGSIPHLVATSDKTGQIYLDNRDSLGHFNPNVNPDVQDFGDGGYSVHSNFAFFNNQLYLAPDGGPVETWSFNPTTEKFTTTVSSKSVHTFGCNGCDGGGSNLAISANGTQNGIVWAIDYSTYGSGPAVLYAYDASNLATLLYASSQAASNRDQAPTAVKFVSPTIANGRVYVPGRNAVVAYGLLSSSIPTAAAPAFSPGGGSYTTAQTVTVSDSTPGTTIHYTTDGSTPTSSSPTYSGPVTINATTTLQAVAIAAGYNPSTVTSAVYNISSSTGGANTVSFGSGFTASGLTLNGFAKLSGSRLRLTDGGVNEAGSAFYSSTLNVQSFVTDFSFQLTNPNADGMAFVIENAGKTALGPAGGGLGYGSDHAGGTSGIAPSIAVKFDLYNNAGEGVDSTGLYVNGASPTVPSTSLTSTGINLHSGDTFKVHAVYSGTVLTMTVTDAVTGKTATQSYTINIPQTVGSNQAYVGFTAGTGGQTATQDILSWTYSPQPYYSAGFSTSNLTFNGGAALNGTKLRLTDGGNNELRSAFYTTPVKLAQFSSRFTFQLTNPNADGFTFTLQGIAPTAVDSSPGGGGLGYGPDQPGGAAGIGKSVAVKFDIYNNAGEGTNSTGLYTNGASPTTPATDLTSSGVNLHSGNVFSVGLAYNGTTLTVTITDTVTKATATQTYTVNIPSLLGAATGFAGFTAGTGGATATQDIQTWTYSTK